MKVEFKFDDNTTQIIQFDNVVSITSSKSDWGDMVLDINCRISETECKSRRYYWIVSFQIVF